MITIEDNDFPIDVATKIIRGTKPFELSEFQKRMRVLLVPESIKDDETMDMFDLEEIKEIADYLMVYYNAQCMEGD